MQESLKLELWDGKQEKGEKRNGGGIVRRSKKLGGREGGAGKKRLGWVKY